MPTPTAADREILPVPDRPYDGPVYEDAKDPDATFAPIEPLRPPEGAPNVLIVLIDDAGFGSSSAFGGPCRTPTAERLAGEGLKLSRFHTTALCSPTRAALLSGRNHHTVGMGGITEIATSAPGYTSVRPNTCAPLAETLKLNGYSTAQFGKCHEVPVWETSPLGPFDSWPSGGGGFEHFYGFIGGETNQYYPAIYEGTTAVEPDRTPEEGYHFTEDMTDRAIDVDPPAEGADGGQAVLRVLRPRCDPRAAPRARGVVGEVQGRLRRRLGRAARGDARAPEGARRRPARHGADRRPAEIPAWDDIADDLKPVLAREMEVYAGFMEHTDHHVGRLVDALEDLGILENTLVFYIIGDNGASAEGDVHGCFNEMAHLNGVNDLETTEFLVSRIDDFGTPDAYNHYAVGWALAMDTPYQWTKQVASHWGGTRNGTIVHWPNGIRARGEVRHQFHHVIDVAPTVLDAAGLPEPKRVHGVAQHPMEGVSMRYAFDDADAADRRETQYFEMFCNRGIYHQGWTAVTRHSIPWLVEPLPPFADDTWELYDTSTDWSQAHDLAAEQPEKLEELKALFLEEARKYNVLPLDDRRVERFNSDIAGRPTLITGHVAAALRRHVTSQRERHAQRQEQVALGHGTDHGSRGRSGGRDHLPGRRVRRLEPLPQGRPTDLLLQPLRRPAVPHREATRPSRPAHTRCAWSSPTTAAASGRAAP